MNLADFSTAVQLALRHTNAPSSSMSRRTRSRSPIRNQLSSPAPSSSAVVRARSKSPSRTHHTTKSLLDLVLSQGAVSAAASSSSATPHLPVQRVVATPTPTIPAEPTSTAAKPSSPPKSPLRSNSPTLSYLILLVALALTLLAPSASALPMSPGAPLPASLDPRESAPTLTAPLEAHTGSSSSSSSASLLNWFPKLWYSISGTAPTSVGGGGADPLESMVALFGPWDDDEWQHQFAADDTRLDEHAHLDAEEAWFHCGGKARFMAGLRNAGGEVVVSAPKCPKSQSTSARVASPDANDKNRVHIKSGAGLPVETAYLSAETLRGTLLYSRPAMVTPHTEL